MANQPPREGGDPTRNGQPPAEPTPDPQEIEATDQIPRSDDYWEGRRDAAVLDLHNDHNRALQRNGNGSPPVGGENTAAGKLAETEAADRFIAECNGRFGFDVRRGLWRECGADGIWLRVIGDAPEKMRTLAPELKSRASIKGALGIAEWRLERQGWDNPRGAAFPGGWIDTASGEIHRTPDPGLLATCAVVEPGQPSDTWATFVEDQICGQAKTLADRRELARWLQAWAWAAFSSQGQRFERFVFLQGQPGGGKSTFADALKIAFGGHAVSLAGERIAGQGQAHREWIAQAHRRRLLVVSELPPKGAAWKSADLSQLISGEDVQANFMRRDSFPVQFRGGLIVTGNTKPRAAAESGIFRRMALLEVQPASDPRAEFKAGIMKLAREGAVTRWIVEGKAAFDAGALEAASLPESIAKAVRAYQSDSDTFGSWLAERCEQGPECDETAKTLHQDYLEFSGGKASQRWLGLRLGEQGFQKYREGRGGPTRYRGLRLRA